MESGSHTQPDVNFLFLPESFEEVGPESETYFREVSSANRTMKTHTELGEGMAKIPNIAGMQGSKQMLRCAGVVGNGTSRLVPDFIG